MYHNAMRISCRTTGKSYRACRFIFAAGRGIVAVFADPQQDHNYEDLTGLETLVDKTSPTGAAGAAAPCHEIVARLEFIS
jgi:hypothetical protein